MTQEEQRTAIAEACGWKCNGHADQIAATVGWEFACQFVIAPEGKLVTHNSIPDYLNDLNAMHDAVMTLNADQMVSMDYHLDVVVGNGKQRLNCEYFLWSATAAQFAKAFLRTIGKWKECK
jgi:hypothetical protein